MATYTTESLTQALQELREGLYRVDTTNQGFRIGLHLTHYSIRGSNKDYLKVEALYNAIDHLKSRGFQVSREDFRMSIPAQGEGNFRPLPCFYVRSPGIGSTATDTDGRMEFLAKASKVLDPGEFGKLAMALFQKEGPTETTDNPAESNPDTPSDNDEDTDAIITSEGESIPF